MSHDMHLPCAIAPEQTVDSTSQLSKTTSPGILLRLFELASTRQQAQSMQENKQQQTACHADV